jgi:hypothetical protein
METPDPPVETADHAADPIAFGLRLRNGKALALVFACDLDQSMATAGTHTTHFEGVLSLASVSGSHILTFSVRYQVDCMSLFMVGVDRWLSAFLYSLA